jgi:hypothetical protein
MPLVSLRKHLTVIPIILFPINALAQRNDDGLINFNIRTLPHWLVYTVTVLVVIGAIRIGFALGRARHKALESKPDPAVAPVSAALMGLLAFILAFSFSSAMSRFELRKSFYLDQVNSLENLYRLAELFPDKYRDALQADVTELVDIRIDAALDPSTIPQAIKHSYRVVNRMWKALDTLYRDPSLSYPKKNLMVVAISDYTSLQTKRSTVAVLHNMPTPAWLMLFGIVVMGMLGMGYQFGQTPNINWTLVVILAFAFSIVIILIADLDRSGAGGRSIIMFDQQAIFDLKARLSRGDLIKLGNGEKIKNEFQGESTVN